MTLDPPYSSSVHTKEAAVGWLVSGLLHVILAISAMLFVQRIQLASQSSPFTWNVAMESTAPAPAPAPATNEAPITAEPVSSAPATSTVAPESQAPNTSPSRMPPTISPPPLESIQEPAVSALPEPLAATSMLKPPQSFPPAEASPPTNDRSATPEHPSSSIVQPTVPAQHESPLMTKERQDFPRTQDETQMAAVASPDKSKPSKVDYAWLSSAMARWIEDLNKRYPAALRSEGIQGKVMLIAVLHENGTLSDIRVGKSSGHDLLDQVALEDVKNGPPLTLARPLERPHISVKFSITYDLTSGR